MDKKQEEQKNLFQTLSNEELARLSESRDDEFGSISLVHSFTEKSLYHIGLECSDTVSKMCSRSLIPDEVISELCIKLIYLRDFYKKLTAASSRVDTRLISRFIYSICSAGGCPNKTAGVVRDLVNHYDVLQLKNTCDMSPSSILNYETLYKLFKPRIRLPDKKAEYVIAGMRRWDEISEVLLSSSTVTEKHFWMVDNVLGLGNVSAACFLRNTGASNVDNEGIPVVEDHIEKFVRILRPKVKWKTLRPRKYGGTMVMREIFESWCNKYAFPVVLADIVVNLVFSRSISLTSIDFGEIDDYGVQKIEGDLYS